MDPVHLIRDTETCARLRYGCSAWFSLAALLFALGINGGCRPGSSGTKVETQDAAPEAPQVPEATWSVTEIPLPNYEELKAVAILGGDIYLASARLGGHLLKSSDGGAHFSEVYSSGDFLRALSGTAGDDVWAAGASQSNEGVVLHSSDGGLTWEESRNNPVGGIEAIWAIDRAHVFVAGVRGVAATSDGGKQWSLVYAADPTRYLWTVWASGLGDIYAAGGIKRSDADAGDDRPDGGPTEWWRCPCGVIIHSVDGGSIWQEAISCWGCALWSLSGSPDGRVVYAVGDFGTVLGTKDRGATWQGENQAGPPNAPITSSEENNPHDTNVGVWVSPTAVVNMLKMESVRSWDQQGRGPQTFLPLPSPDKGYSITWSPPGAIRGTSDDDIWVVGGSFLWHKHR